MKLLLALLLASAPAAAPVEIVAHRGESADAPENTLAAFELAWQRKVPAIELDCHLTRDDRLAVCHDADTQRTAGVKKLIRESTFDELQQLDVGSWKNPKFQGERIPSLEQSLATIPEGSQCFIEIKVGPESVPALVRAVEQSGKAPEQLVVISFNAETVAEAKRRLPQLKAYYLSSFKQNKETGEWSPHIEDLIAEAHRIKADALNLSHSGPWNEEMVRKIRDANLGLYVWTVDDAEIARKMVRLGVDGITTNKGEWLREQLQAPEVAP